MVRIVILVLALVLGCAATGLLAVLVVQQHQAGSPPELRTSYQAVLLTNGQLYFGRLDNVNSNFPVLYDVYYIRSQVSPDSKETTNVLVKRGQEAHAPDRMILNRSHIVLIEPVGLASQIAKAIEERRLSGKGAPTLELRRPETKSGASGTERGAGR